MIESYIALFLIESDTAYKFIESLLRCEATPLGVMPHALWLNNRGLPCLTHEKILSCLSLQQDSKVILNTLAKTNRAFPIKAFN